MEEKGIDLVRELSQEQIISIARHFRLDISGVYDYKDRKVILTLEHLCDYEYFRLVRDDQSIAIHFIK